MSLSGQDFVEIKLKLMRSLAAPVTILIVRVVMVRSSSLAERLQMSSIYAYDSIFSNSSLQLNLLRVRPSVTVSDSEESELSQHDSARSEVELIYTDYSTTNFTSAYPCAALCCSYKQMRAATYFSWSTSTANCHALRASADDAGGRVTCSMRIN